MNSKNIEEPSSPKKINLNFQIKLSFNNIQSKTKIHDKTSKTPENENIKGILLF